MKKGIHHVGITAAQFEKTVRLYQDGLGFTVKHIWGRDKRVYMMEICEESYVEVFEGEAEGGKPHSSQKTGEWMHLALHTDDIEESYRRALDAGAKPLHPPTYADILEAKPEPVYMLFAYVIGFEGEQIEFIQELDGPREV